MAPSSRCVHASPRRIVTGMASPQAQPRTSRTAPLAASARLASCRAPRRARPGSSFAVVAGRGRQLDHDDPRLLGRERPDRAVDVGGGQDAPRPERDGDGRRNGQRIPLEHDLPERQVRLQLVSDQRHQRQERQQRVRTGVPVRRDRCAGRAPERRPRPRRTSSATDLTRLLNLDRVALGKKPYLVDARTRPDRPQRAVHLPDEPVAASPRSRAGPRRPPLLLAHRARLLLARARRRSARSRSCGPCSATRWPGARSSTGTGTGRRPPRIASAATSTAPIAPAGRRPRRTPSPSPSATS